MNYLTNRMTGSFFRTDSITDNVLTGVMISPELGSVERRTLANSESTLYEWREVSEMEWNEAVRNILNQHIKLLIK